MLTDRQRAIVKSTVPLLETGGEALTTHFYRLMLAESAEVQPLFNSVHQQTGAQPRALAMAEDPPPRVDLTYLCRYCDHRDICGTGESLIEGTPRGRSCRTCRHGKLDHNAWLTCTQAAHCEPVPHKVQFRGCDRQHLRVL